MQEIILYDIQSKVGAYSSTTWRARYALGYKRLPFHTIWVEIPDIPDVCRRIGAPPTNKSPNASDQYSLPVIQDPNTGRCISDSFKIAVYLDEVYPDTPLLFPHRDLGLQKAFQDSFHCIFLSSIAKPLRRKSFAAFDDRTREFLEHAHGVEVASDMSLERCCDETRAQAKETYAWVQTCMQANGDDAPFLAGDTLSYSDLVVAASLKWLSKASAEDWSKVSEWHDGRWRRLLAATEELMIEGLEDM
ncbi:hypothetical protein EV715DRAFT_273668 [Schizophyllum commune]